MEKAKEIKNIYTHGYAKTETFHDDYRLQEVLRLVKSEGIAGEARRMLDVGCGDGYFSTILAAELQVREVYGIDISQNAAQEASLRNIRAQAFDIDEGDLSYESGYFDFIYCGSLIELVIDPDHLLQELNRVLKPQGNLIITFPNLCAWASRIAVLCGFQPYYGIVSRKYDVGKMFMRPSEFKHISKGFLRLYTLKAFLQLVDQYGFTLKKVRGARTTIVPRPLDLADRIFSCIPSFAFQIICLLTKK